MAIVNALRFDDHAGAMVADEESWHLRRRKTFFTDNLYALLPRPENPGPVSLAYGGAGDPAFHNEVVRRASRRLEASPPETLEASAREVLAALHETSRRIAGDRIRFLYGITLDDLNRGAFDGPDGPREIKNASVLSRAREIADGKETVAGRDLVPPNEACLIGTDAETGFGMFCIKEAAGVLSFNAGGFESLGAGRYAGGMHLGGHLSRLTLCERRAALPAPEGLRLLLESVLEASEHFGQVGGRFHLLVVDDRRPPPERVRRIDRERALVALEAVRAHRGGFLGEDAAHDLLEAVVLRGEDAEAAEARLFERSGRAEALDLHLRGYKICP